MSFKLTLDGAPIDLFPDFVVDYSIDVYSALEPAEVKSPVSFSNRFPYTDNNISVILYNFDADKSNYPLVPKVYSLTAPNGDIVSVGSAYLSSVVVNSDEPYFELRFEDKATQLIKDMQELKWTDVYKDTFSTQNNTLGSYLAGNEQYDTRDIELAYIDVCNDNERLRYEGRQFTAWGLTDKKVGLIPTLNVNNFLYRMFLAAGENLQSAFAAGVASWKSNNLYALVPSRLMRHHPGQRPQTIRPYLYNVFINQDLVTGVEKNYQVDLYKNTAQGLYLEMPGTNYRATAATENLTYGAYFRSIRNPLVIPDPQTTENRLGYVAWSNGFPGRIVLTNNGTSVTFRLAIPAISFPHTSGLDAGLQLDGIVSVADATFQPKAIVYRSGVAVAELPLLDSSGDPIFLNPASFVNGESIDQTHSGAGHAHQNAILFEEINVFLDYPIDVLSASQYSIAYKIDIQGTIISRVVDDKDNEVSPSAIITPERIAKARVYNYSESSLEVTISTASDFVAVAPTDTFNFQYSLQRSATLSPYQLFSEIVNRFGLSVIYDHISDSFILDTLNDIRSGSFGFPIDPNIDSLNPYEVSGGLEKYAFFKLLNKINGGIYDKRTDELAPGSFDGAVSTGGQGKYSVQFDGAIIDSNRKTVCGPIAPLPDQAIQKLLPSQEVGILNNEILDYEQIGLRFFYLRPHVYKTTIRYPQYIDLNQYGQLVNGLRYNVLGTHFMGGYPININSELKTLEFGTETGLKDFFTYYTNLDKVQAGSRTKMKFRAAVPISYIRDLNFFNQYFYFASPQEEFVIESVQGRIYDSYFYGEFTVRFL